MNRQAATADAMRGLLDIVGRWVVEEIPDNQFGLSTGTAFEEAHAAGQVRRSKSDLVARRPVTASSAAPEVNCKCLSSIGSRS